MRSRVAFIPAAGVASRFGGLPKFLLPSAEFRSDDSPSGNLAWPTLLSRHLSYARRFSDLVILSTRPENSLLLAPYLVPGKVELLVMETLTMSETVLRMSRVVPAMENLILMPDTFFSDEFDSEKMALSEDEILSVAVWEVRPHQVGSVGSVEVSNLDTRPVVSGHRDKDKGSSYAWMWGAMNISRDALELLDAGTPHVGYLLDAILALGDERRVVGARPQRGAYIDCGTPDGFYDQLSLLRSLPDPAMKLKPLR